MAAGSGLRLAQADPGREGGDFRGSHVVGGPRGKAARRRGHARHRRRPKPPHRLLHRGDVGAELIAACLPRGSGGPPAQLNHRRLQVCGHDGLEAGLLIDPAPDDVPAAATQWSAYGAAASALYLASCRWHACGAAACRTCTRAHSVCRSTFSRQHSTVLSFDKHKHRPVVLRVRFSVMHGAGVVHKAAQRDASLLSSAAGTQVIQLKIFDPVQTAGGAT